MASEKKQSPQHQVAIPATFDEGKAAEIGDQIPVDRPGLQIEVDNPFDFLASEDGSYHAGQAMHPNRGAEVSG